MNGVKEGPIADVSAPSIAVATVEARTLAERNGAAALAQVPANATPAQLLWHAIDKGMAAEQIAILAQLERDMRKDAAEIAFAKALAAFQRDCPPIKKNKKTTIATKGGGGYSFWYAELDVLEAHVKPYLEQNDLSYSFDTRVDDKGVLLTNVCTLRHILGHSSQSSFTLPTSSDSAMTAQQRFSAANNFAKRQTLPNVLGISITDKEVPDNEVDPTPITKEQLTAIEDLIESSGADRARFLKYMGAAKLVEILAADYDKAITALKQKQEGARR
jgi:hypothetical protein